MRSIKRKIINYTDIPPGTKVREGTIQFCNHCNRTGRAEFFHGQTIILHAVWIISNEDGSTEAEDEMCPKPSRVPKEDSKSAQ
jgi:hypothetical protein